MTDAPFVGRHRELERLEGHLTGLSAGRSSLLIVTGSAGIGKTTLLKEFRSRIGNSVDTRFVTRCSLFDTASTDPLDRLLQRARRVRPRLIPPMTTEETTPGWLLPVERRLAGIIVEEVLEATMGPAIIVVDDLQWAGPAVLDFAELVAIEIDSSRSKPVMLVAVSRPLPPDHATGSRLCRIESETAVHRMDLDPIDEAADADLIRSIAPEASTTLLDYIRRAAGGNPLMTLATLRLLESRGLPVELQPDDRRSWPTLTYELTTADPLTTWLDSFDPELVRSCNAVALVGAETTVGLAAIAVGDTEDALSGGLEAAVREGLLAASGDWYWFRHDLYTEHFYRRTMAADRRAGHTRLARHLLTWPDRSPGGDIWLCRHLLEANPDLLEAAEAVEALADGGASAFGGRSWPDACRFYEAHLTVRKGPRPERRREAELLLQVGLAHYFNNDHPSATRRLEEALAVAAEVDDDELLAATLVPLLRIRTSRDPVALRRPAGLPELQRFLESTRHPAARSRVLQVRAESLITAGLVEEGTAVARAAYETAMASDDRRTVAFAATANGYAAVLACRPAEAIPWYERAAAAAADTDDWYASNTARCRLSFALVGSGEVTRGALVAEQVGRQAEQDRDFANVGLSHAVRGTAAYLSGDFSTARRQLDQARSYGRRADYAPMPLLTVPALALVAHATDGAWDPGDLEALPPSVVKVLRALRASSSRSGRSDDPVAGRGLGGRPTLCPPRRMTELGVGGLAAAVLTVIDPMVPDDHPAEEQIHEAIEVLEAAVANGQQIATSVPLLLQRALGRALGVLGHFDRALEHLAEAEHLCRAQDCQSELSMTLLETAMAQAQAHRDEEATGQAVEADVLARRLGMPLTTAAARRLHRQQRVASHDSGQLTILVSDVAGSTVVGQRLGDRAYFELVMEHHALVRQLLGVHRGTEFSEGGDSLLAWFDSPIDAFACGLAIQAGAARRRRSGSLLEIKVGVAQGHPFFSHGRPYGSVVNRASRLAGYAPANTVAIDEDTMVQIDVDPVDLRTAAVDLRGIGRETVGIVIAGHRQQWR